MAVAKTRVPRFFRVFQNLSYHLRTIWLFTVSDHTTFVLPETLFGVIGALSGSALTTNPHPLVEDVFARIPLVVAWTWINTFVFVLSNQGNEQAVSEDALNKPWRPLPAQRISLSGTRHLLLFSVPVGLLACYFFLGSFEETAILFSLTWMYNELGGADETFFIRNLIIAVAYGFYGHGALRIATGPHHALAPAAPIWIGVIVAIILSTMSIQDLKDQEGDSARGRHTAPLVFGDTATRWGLAVAIMAWSWIAPAFWEASAGVFAGLSAAGLFVSMRLVRKREPKADKKTWKLWSIWLMGIYCLPLAGR